MDNIPAGILALVSLVLSVLSLGWQIASWALSAFRVRLVLMHGRVTTHGNRGLRPVSPLGTPWDLTDRDFTQIEGAESLAVVVNNLGHLPVWVDNVTGVFLGTKRELYNKGGLTGATFPCEIPPGASQTWSWPLEILVDHTRELNSQGFKVSSVGMRVYFGNGVSRRAPYGLKVDTTRRQRCSVG